MKTFRLGAVLLSLAATGCSAPSLSPKVDAADAESRFGDLLSRYDVAVTGRDWNCKGCYK